jgi:hypothetical protein
VRIDLRSFERQASTRPHRPSRPRCFLKEDKGIQTEIGNYNREIKAHNATVKSIKSLIVSLEAWFVKCQEKLTALFGQGRKSRPTLMSILNTYNSIRRKGGPTGATRQTEGRGS